MKAFFSHFDLHVASRVGIAQRWMIQVTKLSNINLFEVCQGKDLFSNLMKFDLDESLMN